MLDMPHLLGGPARSRPNSSRAQHRGHQAVHMGPERLSENLVRSMQKKTQASYLRKSCKQTIDQNCFSVTPALMIPVDEVPPDTMLPISSTISEPLHFWCVSVSTLFSRS